MIRAPVLLAFGLVLAAAVVFGLAGCQRPPEAVKARAVQAQAAQRAEIEAAPTNKLTLARVCPGGVKVYGPEPYAVWENGAWTNLEGPLWSVC